jgi:hypothetical protein
MLNKDYQLLLRREEKMKKVKVLKEDMNNLLVNSNLMKQDLEDTLLLIEKIIGLKLKTHFKWR